MHGLGGLLGSFTVAMKQVMPDSILLDFSFLRLKQDNLPLLLIFISLLVYLFGLTDLTYVLMMTFGVFYGWIYLRFFQKHNNGTRGDSSSSFVFARYLFIISIIFRFVLLIFFIVFKYFLQKDFAHSNISVYLLQIIYF